MRFTSLWTALLLALFVPLAGANAQRGPAPTWELLGEQDVGFNVDNDSVEIRQSEDWFRDRGFDKLRFNAERNDIELISIGIIYINGHTEEIRVGRTIPRNGEMIVDLPGQRSYLKRIDMRYRAKLIGSGGLRLQKAKVKVYGQSVPRRIERPVVAVPPPISGGWDEIETKTFNTRDDRVVLGVGRSDGRFGQIKLRVVGAPARIDEVRIRFGNGETQTVNVNRRLDDGEETRAIDLVGDRRFIQTVTVELDPTRRPGRAEIQLLGIRRPGNEGPAPDPYAGRGWVKLGEQSVGFTTDRDVINVGQNEDWFRNRAFSRLHLVAERNDIHMMSLRLVYLNGHTEELRVDRMIQAGTDLAVDLRGERSFLRQIEMVYRSRPSFRGQAVVKVYGETGRR